MIKEIRALSRPLTAQLEIINGCNHRCIHCYLLSPNDNQRPIVESSDNVIIACVKKLVEAGIFAVVITGGEPLLKKNLLIKVITLFTNNSIKVSLNTNLTLLDDELATFLKDMGVSILTSCPSANKEKFNSLTNTHNYQRFESNIKKLSKLDIYFTVNMVVTKDNINDIIETATNLNKIGCKSFAATPMSLNMDYPLPNLSLSIKEVQKVVSDLLYIKKHLGMKIDIVESLPKCCLPKDVLEGDYPFLKRRCQAGRISISVSSNGDVRPCGHNSQTYGNIIFSRIEDIFEKLQDWRSGKFIPQECYECTWIDFCNGGCRTNAYASRRKWNEKDIWMTNPISEIKPLQKKEDILIQNYKLKINTNYRIRKEDEDIYLVYNLRNNAYFMVNPILLDFINDLCFKFKETTFEDLALYYGAKDNKNFEIIIKYLFLKGILYSIN